MNQVAIDILEDMFLQIHYRIRSNKLGNTSKFLVSAKIVKLRQKILFSFLLELRFTNYLYGEHNTCDYKNNKITTPQMIRATVLPKSAVNPPNPLKLPLGFNKNPQLNIAVNRKNIPNVSGIVAKTHTHFPSMVLFTINSIIYSNIGINVNN